MSLKLFKARSCTSQCTVLQQSNLAIIKAKSGSPRQFSSQRDTVLCAAVTLGQRRYHLLCNNWVWQGEEFLPEVQSLLYFKERLTTFWAKSLLTIWVPFVRGSSARKKGEEEKQLCSTAEHSSAEMSGISGGPAPPGGQSSWKGNV